MSNDIAKQNMVEMLVLLHDAMTALEDLLAVVGGASECRAATTVKAQEVANKIRRAIK